jgi:multiple sugar transport system permease protein
MVPYLYVLPALALTVLWVYWPVLGTVQLSFYEWNLLPSRAPVWVGTANYEQLLNQPELARALVNTCLYILGLLPFAIVLPLGVALLLGRVRGAVETFYRGVIFLPVLMAPIVVAVIWRWIMNPSGILNDVLHSAFQLQPVNMLSSPALALWAIVLITGWKLLGFSTLIISAGLTNISRDCLEAAQIDGADTWQRIRYVILPLLSPTLLFMVLLTVLLASQWTFPIINALTQGGPRSGTTNVYYVLWQFGFQTFNVGLSSAAGILFFSGFLGLAIGTMRLIDRYSFYDA